MCRIPRLLLATAALGLCAAPAAALNLTFGDVVVQGLDDYGFTTNSVGGNVLSFDGGTTDELYQMFGYIGTASDNFRIDAGANFTTTGVVQTGANTAQSDIQLSNAGATALGFGAPVGASSALDIVYGYRLFDDTSPADADWMEWAVSFTNNTASVMNFSFYTYLDLDLEGAADFADDTAYMRPGITGAMVVGDASNPAVNFIWNAFDTAPTNFQIGNYPTIRNTLENMTSNGNLNNSPALGTTYGPADFTAAFQYNLTLNPGQTLRLRQAIPEPGVVALLITGLVGLAGFPSATRRAG